MSELTGQQRDDYTNKVFSEHGFLDVLGYRPVENEETGKTDFFVELPKGFIGNRGQFVRITPFNKQKRHKSHWHELVEKQSDTEYGEVWSIEFLDDANIPDNVPDAPWMEAAPPPGTVVDTPEDKPAYTEATGVMVLKGRLDKAAGVIKTVRRDNEDLKESMVALESRVGELEVALADAAANVRRLEELAAGKAFDQAKVPATVEEKPAATPDDDLPF